MPGDKKPTKKLILNEAHDEPIDRKHALWEKPSEGLKPIRSLISSKSNHHLKSLLKTSTHITAPLQKFAKFPMLKDFPPTAVWRIFTDGCTAFKGPHCFSEEYYAGMAKALDYLLKNPSEKISAEYIENLHKHVYPTDQEYKSLYRDSDNFTSFSVHLGDSDFSDLPLDGIPEFFTQFSTQASFQSVKYKNESLQRWGLVLALPENFHEGILRYSYFEWDHKENKVFGSKETFTNPNSRLLPPLDKSCPIDEKAFQEKIAICANETSCMIRLITHSRNYLIDFVNHELKQFHKVADSKFLNPTIRNKKIMKAIITLTKSLHQTHCFPDGNGRTFIFLLQNILSMQYFNTLKITHTPYHLTGFTIDKLIEEFHSDIILFNRYKITAIRQYLETITELKSNDHNLIKKHIKDKLPGNPIIALEKLNAIYCHTKSQNDRSSSRKDILTILKTLYIETILNYKNEAQDITSDPEFIEALAFHQIIADESVPEIALQSLPIYKELAKYISPTKHGKQILEEYKKIFLSLDLAEAEINSIVTFLSSAMQKDIKTFNSTYGHLLKQNLSPQKIAGIIAAHLEDDNLLIDIINTMDKHEITKEFTFEDKEYSLFTLALCHKQYSASEVLLNMKANIIPTIEDEISAAAFNQHYLLTILFNKLDPKTREENMDNAAIKNDIANLITKYKLNSTDALKQWLADNLADQTDNPAINKSGDTIFHFAAIHGLKEVVKLLSSQSNAYSTNHNGETPTIALINRCIQRLTETKDDKIELIRNQKILSLMASQMSPDDLKTLNTLEKQHTNPEIQALITYTKLWYFANNNEYEKFKSLLNNNTALIHHTDSEDRTLLHYAVMTNDTRLAALLFQQGAKDTTRDSRHKLPSDYLSPRNERALVNLFMEKTRKHDYLDSQRLFSGISIIQDTGIIPELSTKKKLS